ncbi:hypothetical protein [Aureimonas sp. SK2]|uniref:hypothetical protein n=1 Tax=Aureimonas sp. SK2 TaxID=3015992 RepID=UPI0024448606|nr:hypothetical protein [Aureimonas sp. SK2]
MTDDLLAQLEAVASSGFQPVTAGALTVPLRPVTLVECLRILRRFPALKAALIGGEADEASILDVLLDSGPEAVAALVAAAAGKPSADYEAVIARLPDDVLIPLVHATIQLTAPEGIEPFFARLTKLAGVAGMAEAPAAAPAGKRIRKAA